MYAFTVGFKSGDPTPVQLYGPGTPVAEQDAHLDRAARLDDGDGYVTVEIVYSNGRAKRRVDFTTPAQKEASAARAAAAQAAKESKAQAETEARIAALEAELQALKPSSPAPEIEPTVKESLPVASDQPANPEPVIEPVETAAPAAAALEAEAEAASNETAEDTATPVDGAVSGKRRR